MEWRLERQNDKNYKPEGYNPIEGEWQAYSLNGKEYTDHYYIKFSDKRYMYEYTKKPAEGKDPVFNSFREYIINDKAFKAKTDLYYTYNLKNNILTLINSSSTWLLKPYIYKEWRWEGNWNDPRDSHFAEYQGKYNPIKGEWKITHIDGLETSSKSIITFTEDFKWINEIGEVSKYNINATGLESLKDYYRHKYTITDNTLILLTMFPKQGVPLTYKRIK